MSDALKAKLAKVGLEVAESHVIQAIDDVYKIAEVVAADTENKVDDAVLVGLTLLKSTLQDLADKINPDDNE